MLADWQAEALGRKFLQMGELSNMSEFRIDETVWLDPRDLGIISARLRDSRSHTPMSATVPSLDSIPNNILCMAQKWKVKVIGMHVTGGLFYDVEYVSGFGAMRTVVRLYRVSARRLTKIPMRLKAAEARRVDGLRLSSGPNAVLILKKDFDRHQRQQHTTTPPALPQQMMQPPLGLS